MSNLRLARFLQVKAKIHGNQYKFSKNEVIRFSVSESKDVSSVVLTKDVIVDEETEAVKIILEENETRIGEPINKPKIYWYEVELNPDTNPCTIIGYGEDGAKTFTLYPEIENADNKR